MLMGRRSHQLNSMILKITISIPAQLISENSWDVECNFIWLQDENSISNAGEFDKWETLWKVIAISVHYTGIISQITQARYIHIIQSS